MNGAQFSSHMERQFSESQDEELKRKPWKLKNKENVWLRILT